MLRRRIKIVIPIAIIIILLIGLGIYMSLSAMNEKPLQLVERFENAMVKGNTKQVMDMIQSGDPLFEITEESTQQLIAYYRDNPLLLANEIEQLEREAKRWNEDTDKLSSTSLFSRVDPKSKNILSIVKKEETNVLSGKYGVGLRLSYFKVRTNQKDTVFSLNDKEILTAKVDDYDKVLGPYLPGIYELRVDYKGEYVTLSETKKVQLPNDHDKEIDLSLKAQYIYPTSNDLDAQLFVEGKDTGIKFKDMDRFGPVASDGSMVLHAEKKSDWGVLSSKKVTITKDNIYPELDLQGIYIEPATNFNNAELFINDTNTGTVIDYDRFVEYGPLPHDSTLTMHVERKFPWGTYKSEKKPILEHMEWEDRYLIINATDENIEEQIMKDMNTFLISYITAHCNNDITMLTNATDYYKSMLEDEIVESQFDGDVVGTAYDIGSLSLYGGSEEFEYMAYITAKVTVNQVYLDFIEPIVFDWSLDVSYNEETQIWEVTSINDSMYFDDTNKREFTF